MTKPKDFELAMNRLEEIITMMESGDPPMSVLLEMYEEGVELQKFCHTKLDEAERKIELLVKKSDDHLEKKPFPEENNSKF